mmetsp:Transcript_28881/g.35121  ORF Transcript_28881/g.35121 Transcript_28881/m.35121 type:complete len:398 (-) Transcript_28881:326-1519(-)
MESFFNSLLGAYQMHMDGNFNIPNNNAAPQKVPPVSRKALRQIPTVIVTPDDLADENNRECCICFEENRQGDKVARLPCGHLYHRPCITSWLNKHCTCPICRYELETDNPDYEVGRQERMKHRKPRFRKYELQNLRLADLRLLCEKLNISHEGVLEKRELVERVLASGKVEIVASPAPLEFRLTELRGMGVGKLRRVMNEGGVFFDPVDVVEKEDMVQIFINSGRVLLVEEEKRADDGDEEETFLDDAKPAAVLTTDSGTNGISFQAEPNSLTMEIEDKNDMEVCENNSTTEMDVKDNTEVQVEEINQQHAMEGTNITIENEYQSQDDAVASSPLEEMNVDNTPAPVAAYPSLTTNTSNFATRSVSQLKALARELNIDVSDCLEKREIIQKLSRSLR